MIILYILRSFQLFICENFFWFNLRIDSTGTQTGKVLKVLAELTDRTGFESALNTVNQALCYGAKDADSLINLYRRIYADVPELPQMPLDPKIPDIGQMETNLIAYDDLLRKGGTINA